MADGSIVVTGGVDTHKDSHAAAVLDSVGQVLGCEEFSANAQGYDEMIAWMRSFGELSSVGVEGTGSYGAGLTRRLLKEGVEVLEVLAPDRSERRRRGKSDEIDAVQAARAALSGARCRQAKALGEELEALRALEAAYASCVKAKTAASNALKAQVVTLPEDMREQLDGLKASALVKACAFMRPGKGSSARSGLKAALRALARRVLALKEEADALEARIDALTLELVPSVRALDGAGPHVAARLALAAGKSPERLGSEASFSMLCGASPVPASSGKTDKLRLSRAGDRRANSALYTMAITRMGHDARTRAYVARRLSENKTKKEVIRCLKRYIAREVYGALLRDMAALEAA